MAKGKNRGVRGDKFNNDWNLNWFVPSDKQKEALEKFDHSVFNIVPAATGCGKTTMALWYAFNEYRKGTYDKLIFMKTPAESGTDEIGLIKGGLDEKLTSHLMITRMIMEGFIAKNKLDCDINNGNIRVTIPNYELGATYDNTIVVIDECQLMNPATMKFLTERCGENSKYLLLGDNKQNYAINYRDDGFSDFIGKFTKEDEDDENGRVPLRPDMVSYTRMTYLDNMRSEGSAYITEVYDD